MPRLRSKEGVSMLKRYVDNWGSVLAVYANLKRKTTVKFKDATTMPLAKDNYYSFYGELYKRYLHDHGFKVYDNFNRTMVETPHGLKLYLPNARDLAYLTVLDEVYLIKIYGEPDLTGRVVIDIGASVADTALYFGKCGAKVFGYETDYARYKTALENIKLNDMQDKITIFNEKADADSINALMEKEGVSNVFLKVDCEGCEYDLLPKIDFSKVREIVMEYHGEPSLLFAILDRAGLTVKLNKKAAIISASRIEK